MRLRRERARAGRCVVAIEIDEDDIEVLCAARLLDPLAEHTREDIGHAIVRLLKTLPLRCE